jgi:methanogenic corrinoid protein MtbC1
MSDQDFQQAMTKVSGTGTSQNVQLDALTLSMMEMDELRFNSIINENIKMIGFEKTMLGVIYPFLEKMSMLWLTGSVTHSQESFISNLIRQKLLTAIDKIEVNKKKSAKKFVLYLPKGENQELSLQLMHFLLKVRNFYVVYLGADMTVSDVDDAVRIMKPDYVFTMITETYVGESIINYVSRMKKQFSDTHLLLSGYQVVAQNLPNSEKVTVLRSLGETIEHIDNL